MAWGPRRVGDAVLVATEHELFCLDKRPELVWHVPLENGLPLDTPLEHGSEFTLATTDGTVARIDVATGEVRKKVDLEQPLAGGPIASGAEPNSRQSRRQRVFNQGTLNEADRDPFAHGSTKRKDGSDCWLYLFARGPYHVAASRRRGAALRAGTVRHDQA